MSGESRNGKSRREEKLTESGRHRLRKDENWKPGRNLRHTSVFIDRWI